VDEKLTVRQLIDVFTKVLEPAKDVLERGRRPEVLLLETKFLSD
jgi:hypothetical protein